LIAQTTTTPPAAYAFLTNITSQEKMPEMVDFESACETGDLATVARLIEEREKSSQANEHWQEDLRDGLFHAAWDGHRAIVALLLSHGDELHQSAFIASLRHVAVFEEFTGFLRFWVFSFTFRCLA
jgi:hypothetical protein